MTQPQRRSASSDQRDVSWTPGQNLRVLLFIAITMGIAAALSTWSSPPGRRVLPLVFFAAFGLLMFLMIRFQRVKGIVSILFAGYLKFTGVMLVTVGPLAGFSWLSRVMLDKFPLWAQVIVFIVWGLLLSYALLLIATKARRNRLLTSLQHVNLAMPIAYSLLVLMLAQLFFSSATFVMSQHGLLSLVDQTGRGVTPGSLSDFFLWHFLEAIPLLKVNDTLRWKAPLGYDSAAVGWMLLLFKAAVIVPVIGAFTWYWKREKPTANVDSLPMVPGEEK